MSYLEMAKQAKQARAELRHKRPNDQTPADATPSVVMSFMSYRSAYAHPWPDALPGLGRRTIGPFDMCQCGAWSWARFGGRILCLACALKAGEGTPKPPRRTP
jgi:hypothetical protein